MNTPIDTVEGVERFDYGAGTNTGLEPDPDGNYVTYEAMVAIVAKYKKDAERYRWLRAKYANGEETYYAEDCAHSEEGIDAEIDAKMNAVIDTKEGG